MRICWEDWQGQGWELPWGGLIPHHRLRALSYRKRRVWSWVFSGGQLRKPWPSFRWCTLWILWWFQFDLSQSWWRRWGRGKSWFGRGQVQWVRGEWQNRRVRWFQFWLQWELGWLRFVPWGRRRRPRWRWVRPSPWGGGWGLWVQGSFLRIASQGERTLPLRYPKCAFWGLSWWGSG